MHNNLKNNRNKNFKKKMEIETEAPLSTDVGDFTIVSFSNSPDGKEHIALVKGDVRGKESVLTRIHSECMTGDVFGSMRCECGSQLKKAMSDIEKNGEGVLLYLRQEGRGIGINNKIKAYALQTKGADTLDANLLLGFEGDSRDYRVASEMLDALGVKSVNLLTNNPLKIEGLIKYGTVVAKVHSHIVGVHSKNSGYMDTKRDRMGHKL